MNGLLKRESGRKGVGEREKERVRGRREGRERGERGSQKED